MAINTQNLISTPNITGDISTCKTEGTILNGASRPNFFIQEDVGYMTNNCTGQTDVYKSWQVSQDFRDLLGNVGFYFTIVLVAWIIIKGLKKMTE